MHARCHKCSRHDATQKAVPSWSIDLACIDTSILEISPPTSPSTVTKVADSSNNNARTYSAASTAANGSASPEHKRARTRADAWSDAASFADLNESANVAAPSARYAAAATGTDLAATVGATTIPSGVSETQAARKRPANSKHGAPQ